MPSTRLHDKATGLLNLTNSIQSVTIYQNRHPSESISVLKMLPEPDGTGLFSALPIRKAFRADGQGRRLNSLAAHICGFRRETCGPDAGSWPVDTLQWQNARNAAADRAYRSDFRKPLTESTGKTMSTQEKTQPKRAYHSPRRPGRPTHRELREAVLTR